MLYVGVDCSIRDTAFAVASLGISMHYDTELSLTSTPQDFIERAKEVTGWLTCLEDEYILLVDFTMYQMKARQSQMRLNSLFIGAILACARQVHTALIEPKTVRKALGLKGNASKDTVYVAFNEQYPKYAIWQYAIHHVKDAVVLSALAEEGLI